MPKAQLWASTEGRVFRSINKAEKIWGNGMTPKVVWEVVKEAADRCAVNDKLGIEPDGS